MRAVGLGAHDGDAFKRARVKAVDGQGHRARWGLVTSWRGLTCITPAARRHSGAGRAWTWRQRGQDVTGRPAAHAHDRFMGIYWAARGASPSCASAQSADDLRGSVLDVDFWKR